MPRRFCGGSGAVQNGFSLFIGFRDFFIAHLASRILNGGMQFLYEGIDFRIQFPIFARLWLVCSCHSGRAFLRRIWFFGHTVYPIRQAHSGKVTKVVTPLDYANALEDGRIVAYFSRFAHRALAAFKARSLRCSSLIVTRLAFPPIFPPFRPIADITREISDWDALGDFRVRLVGSGSAVDRCTI